MPNKQVQLYLKLLKQGVEKHEQDDILQSIHLYGNPQDYTRAIRILRDKQEEDWEKERKKQEKKLFAMQKKQEEAHRKFQILEEKELEEFESEEDDEVKEEDSVEKKWIDPKEKEDTVEPQAIIENPIQIQCEICNAMVKNPKHASHIKSKRHQKALEEL